MDASGPIRVTSLVNPVDVRVEGGALHNDGPGTIFYAANSHISPVNFDGQIVAGASATLEGVQWLIAAGECRVWVQPLPAPPADAVVDADAVTKGIIQLAGDLSGTAASPTVVRALRVMRGQLQANTGYIPGDVVVAGSKRRLIKASVTSNSSTPPFISGSTYDSLDATTVVYATDFGWTPDANQVTAVNNTAAMKAALAYCNAIGGGVVEIPTGFAFVAKDGGNTWAIDIPSFVTLRGQGMNPSRIQLADNQNCNVIRTHTSSGSGNSNAFFCGVENITIDGNKANNASGGHGLDMTTIPQYTTQTGDPFFDCHHLIRNIRIQNCKQNGINMSGRSANILMGVYIKACDGHGIQGTFDTHYISCEAEGCGLAGFKRFSQAVNCKSFLNGTVDQTQGHGFWQTTGGTMVDCQAQNNYGHGLLLDASNGNVVQGFGADTNNAGNQGCVAVAFINGSSNNIIDFASGQSSQAGAGVLGYQQDCVQIDSGCTKNDVRGVHAAGAGNTVNLPGVKAGSVLTGNFVRINAVSLTDTLSSHVDTTIASLTDGQALVYDSALGKWKNGSPGAGSAFSVGAFGDGSDGNVAFDGVANAAASTRSGTVYTLTRNLFAINVTLSAGATIKTNGYIIFCTGTWTDEATSLVQNDGNDGLAAGNSGAGTSATSTGAGTTGGNGNTGAGSAAGANGGALIGVGAGGAGGLGSSGAGGNGVGAFNTSASPLKSVLFAVAGIPSQGSIKIISGAGGGGGGGGDGTNKGGGGGSGGGAVVIIAKNVVHAGAWSAKGGNGGDAITGNAGGGGGGGGGLILVYSLNAITNTGTTVTTGGTAGLKQGTGVNGTAGGNGAFSAVLVV